MAKGIGYSEGRAAGRFIGFFLKRQHPIMILRYIAKYLWLLVIPLGKYLIASKFNFESWIKANWVDILTLSVIVGYGILRWIFIYFEITDDSVIAHTGYFGISRTRVYFREMSSMSLCQGYFYRLIGACSVYIDTDAKSIQSSDITLDITQKQASRIYELASQRCRNKPKYIYKARKSDLMIFSLLFSSTLSGMLLTLTFIYEVYHIFGREIEMQFIERLNNTLESLTLHIPKYLIAASVLLIGSWLLSFVSNLMRHWGFTCTRCWDMLFVSSGKGTRRRHILMRSRINYIDYQQTMLMKFFRICMVSVNCTGYGKRRLEINALVPITTNDHVAASIKMLMPGTPKVDYDIRTGSFSDVTRFITIPLILCAVPWVVYNILCRVIVNVTVITRIVPDWQRSLRSLTVLSMLPLIWLLIVKLYAAFNTAVGLDSENCTLSYCRFTRFHRTVLRRDRISKIVVSQNPFQRVSRTCTLKIYTNSEKKSTHTVGSLRYNELIKVISPQLEVRS